MKKLLFIAIAFFMGLGVYAQTLPYVDNFDSYTAGDYMAVSNPDWWTTWSNAPGTAEDGKISTDFAQSTPNSVWIGMTGSSATDLILKLGNKTAGVYELKWSMYVPTGFCGYYNIQHFQSPGIEWAYRNLFPCRRNIPNFYEGGEDNQWYISERHSGLRQNKLSTLIMTISSFTLTEPFSKNGPSVTRQAEQPEHCSSAALTSSPVQSQASGETPKCYIDDLSYTQTGGGGDPVISVDPTSLHTWLVAGTTGTGDLTLSNTGLSDLNVTGSHYL